jgi:hypothetical protein
MLHFGKIPKKMVKFNENSAEFGQKLGRICELLEKNSKKFSNF